jgi:hypothetical protein
VEPKYRICREEQKEEIVAVKHSPIQAVNPLDVLSVFQTILSRAVLQGLGSGYVQNWDI